MIIYFFVAVGHYEDASAVAFVTEYPVEEETTGTRYVDRGQSQNSG
jgi:hypothetical protein